MYGCSSRTEDRVLTILQEILSKEIPYHYLSELQAIVTISKGNIPARPAIASRSNELLWAMCKLCWNLKPKHRMTAQEAINFLNNVRSSLDKDIERSWISRLTSFLGDQATDWQGMANMLTWPDSDTEQPDSKNTSSEDLRRPRAINVVGERRNRKGFYAGIIRLSNTRTLDLSCGFQYDQWTRDEGNVNAYLKFPLRQVPRKMVLTSKLYKKLELSWQIKMPPLEGLTNYHVLHAIYSFLFIHVDDVELRSFNQKQRNDARKSCERRCRKHPNMSGLRRVDFLCNFRWLKGIRLERERGGIHTYTLLTRDSNTPEELALD